jgi:hypothetical protein
MAKAALTPKRDRAAANIRYSLGFTAQPLTPLNRPGKENQNFEFFFKVLRKF